MAEMAITDRITHVIATHHANDTYPFLPEMVQRRQDEIQARLGKWLIAAYYRKWAVDDDDLCC